MSRKPARIVEASLAELRQRASLSIPEARRLTGLSRPTIDKHLDSRDWSWFWEGARRRVVTESIYAHQDKRSREDMLAAA